MNGTLDRALGEELVAREAQVALTAVGIEDPELRSPPRRTKAVAADDHLGPLADHVAAEADPAPPGKIEPQPGRLGDGGPERRARRRRLEEDEERLRAPGQGGQPVEPIHDARAAATRRAGRQVDDENIDGPSGEDITGDRQALVQAVRGDDDEPVEVDTAADGLDRIEAPPDVQPRGDRPARLGLGDDPERERRLAAPPFAAESDARRARQPAGSEDRVERGEPGRDDPLAGPWERDRFRRGIR